MPLNRTQFKYTIYKASHAYDTSYTLSLCGAWTEGKLTFTHGRIQYATS
jgi:hypothetical protein